jgi:hypothetical protein
MIQESKQMESKIKELPQYSDFGAAQEKAYQYLGVNGILFISPKQNKKYRVYNPNTNKWVDFGAWGMEDFTKHKDEERRERYLKRATAIRGDWAGNKFSPNNLAIHVLW